MELIKQLDPERNYGDRTYEQVVREVEAGSLILKPGHSLPVIIDSRTKKTVSGTGRPPGKPAAVFSRGYIERQFARNAQRIWEAAFEGAVKNGDPRWGKLLFEYGIGKPKMDSGSASSAQDFLKILAAAAESSRRVDIHTEVIGE